MLDIFLMSLVNMGGFAELAFSFAPFFREDMAFPSLFTLNFTGSSFLKAFLSPTV